MRRKNKKIALRAVFVYLLLSGGSWMFINSYANSFNRLNGGHIIPAGIVIGKEEAAINVLNYSVEFDMSGISPDSRGYCAAYLLSPDELRAAAYLISLCI